MNEINYGTKADIEVEIKKSRQENLEENNKY